MSWETEYKKKLQTADEALRAFDPAREFTFSRAVRNRRRWWKP